MGQRTDTRVIADEDKRREVHASLAGATAHLSPAEREAAIARAAWMPLDPDKIVQIDAAFFRSIGPAVEQALFGGQR